MLQEDEKIVQRERIRFLDDERGSGVSCPENSRIYSQSGRGLTCWLQMSSEWRNGWMPAELVFMRSSMHPVPTTCLGASSSTTNAAATTQTPQDRLQVGITRRPIQTMPLVGTSGQQGFHLHCLIPDLETSRTKCWSSTCSSRLRLRGTIASSCMPASASASGCTCTTRSSKKRRSHGRMYGGRGGAGPAMGAAARVHRSRQACRKSWPRVRGLPWASSRGCAGRHTVIESHSWPPEPMSSRMAVCKLNKMSSVRPFCAPGKRGIQRSGHSGEVFRI